MDVADYIGFVASEGERFAAVAEKGPLDVDIATCEGWDMRELVRHVGLIHLWAAANVAFPADRWLRVRDLPDLAGHWPDLATAWPDDANLVSWYRDTHANLIGVLEAAPTDHRCYTFLPAPSPVSMWARRQASEIAIHRFDAEVSRGVPSHFAPAFAADMLDELLSGFATRHMKLPVEREVLLHVHALDVDEHWHLTADAEGIATARSGGDADLTVTAPAADLYLLMWNRGTGAGVDLSGDAEVMDLWRDNCHVRWR
ncbi:MAG: maleylpyruvate isomerase family mycothiol-dependent enzyme [Acidimicrobiales bacterium]